MHAYTGILSKCKRKQKDNPEIQATRHRTKTIQRYRQQDTERRQSRDTGNKTQNEDNQNEKHNTENQKNAPPRKQKRG
jgi:hypothetical protein